MARGNAGRNTDPAEDAPKETDESQGSESGSDVAPSPPDAPASDAVVVEAPGTVVAEPLKLAPDAWARRLGHVGKVSGLTINKKPVPAPFSWRHAAADQIHGWSLHKQHTTTPLTLLQGDYEAALKAAEKPDKDGNYQPHPAALSQFRRGN